MKIRTAAKINLALDVCGILENGYHSIKSVFQTVGLYDEITVKLRSVPEITVECIQPEGFAKADPIPNDEKNIAYKAANLFFSYIKPHIDHEIGCRIVIKKGIPSQAGMGGGSSDAAAVLYCLNKLTGQDLSAQKLAGLGKKIGADVPFFFMGGTALVEGIGEKLSSLPDFSGQTLVIAKGTEGVSTVEAYKAVDSLVSPVHPDVDGLAAVLKNDKNSAYRYFSNIFEDAVDLEEVVQIRDIMKSGGALSAVMTGSGSAVFGLFTNKNTADECCGILRQQGFFAEVCQTVPDSFCMCD